MALAPQNILSKLRMMPDAELASFARAHQNDPYIFPLAFQESQDRQHLRSSKQAQATGAQQPKVVQQDLQEMEHAAVPAMGAAQQLPENVGIGQLPAQNIQNMAGGGIVAFDEGGRVSQKDVQAAYDAWMAAQPSWYQQTTPTSAQRVAEAEQRYKQLLNAYQTQPSNVQPGSVPAAVPASIPTAPTVPAVKTTAAPTVASAPQGGIDKLIPVQKPAAPAGDAGGNYDQRFLRELSKGEVSKEDRLKEIEGINKPVLEKMASLIDDNKNKLKTEKEQNFYMALIQGGLAAAGASGPNALQNLAQGFEKGAAGYSEGLKDLRKAAQENSKMELAMAEYEASGKKDALKSVYDHQDKMLAARTQGLSNIYGHLISKEGQIAAAGAGANAQRSLMEALGKAPEDSALRKGFELTKQESRIPAMYQAYVTAATDPMKGEDFLKKYPTFDVYRAGMGGAGSGQFITLPNGAPPSTSVLPRKN